MRNNGRTRGSSKAETAAEVVNLRAVDLFSGCGGLSLGLKAAGINLVHAFDSWPDAVSTYKENLDHPCQLADLSNVEATLEILKGLDFNMIAGGPPCQDFSHAGKRTEGSRASLTGCFADIVSHTKPDVFIMENVDRAQTSLAYANARSQLESCGYFLTERTLNAALCGVPQTRKRFFCIGVFDPNTALRIGALLDDRLASRELTIREYMGKELDIELYYRHPRNYSRRAIYSIDEPAPTMRGVNRPVPSGYPGHPGDAGQITKTLRPLSTIERGRVQTFPKNFKWVGSKTAIEQMVGNAVPVNLAKYVGKAVLDGLLGADS